MARRFRPEDGGPFVLPNRERLVALRVKGGVMGRWWEVTKETLLDYVAGRERK